MAEALWKHSLEFLENYRTCTSDHGIAHLYDFEDKTGILSRHRETFENSFLDNQVDMKYIVQELINMLLDDERGEKGGIEFAGLDGYQDLTNRLQRSLYSGVRSDITKLENDKQLFNESVEKKLLQMEKKLQLVERDKFEILEKMIKLEEENLSLRDEIHILDKSMNNVNNKSSKKELNKNEFDL